MLDMSSAQLYDIGISNRHKADALNKEEGHLQGYNCPKCRNKGYFFIGDTDRIISQECSCMPKRGALARMQRFGVDAGKYTFDGFSASDEWQKLLKTKAMGFVESPVGWFMISGQSGCGKTHLCVAVCSALINDGREVIYAPWRETIQDIKRQMRNDYQGILLLDELKKADVVYIDDFMKSSSAQGNSSPTDADVSIAYELINVRYVGNKTTIFSTERNMTELLSYDEAMAGRIAEKCGDNIVNIPQDIHKNYRLRNMRRL